MPLFEHTPCYNCTLLIGLGNPILGDDGVGWRVVEQVQLTLRQNSSGIRAYNLEVDCLSVGGLGLMERLVGYKSAILVDAITTRKYPPGTVYNLDLAELPVHALGHLSSSHDTTLQIALEMGRQMGVPLPEHIRIIAIEAEQIFEFSESLSPEVAAAMPTAVDHVFQLLNNQHETILPGLSGQATLPQGG